MPRLDEPMIVPERLADPDVSVAAILVTEDGRYLLQRRDSFPTIWFPDHWGLFGGAIDVGETPEQTLLRELAEELEFVPHRYAYFTQVGFDLTLFGHDVKLRYFYEVPVTAAEVAAMPLHEGAGKRLFTAAEILNGADLTPYDSFALRLHLSRPVIARAPAP